MKDQLQHLVASTLAQLQADGQLPEGELPAVIIERARSKEFGDFATNAAMTLARFAKRKPRDLADQIIAAMPAHPDIAKLEIAGPGFINIFLTPAAYHAEVKRVLELGPRYGRNEQGQGRHVGIEYVSANPTGPLHFGHARGAAIGDCIGRVLDANGWKVSREYYYNDAGVQIANLAISVQARARGITPDDAGWPENGYRGDYIAEVARAFLDRATVEADGQSVTANGDIDDLDAIRVFAVASLRHEQNLDLKAFGIDFDVYFLESSLYADGKVEETVDALTKQGHTYEDGGALWLRTTDFGDDKDRVMRKSDGTYTYFVPDVAYHMSKWQRGYQRAITELGADHHGSLARVKAGLQALDCGIPAGYPEYVLHQMATVIKDGVEVKISKRAGSYLTLRDLVEEAGRDATRYFMIARKGDSQLVFDINLARSQSNDNPVYYIQYAHARVCSVLRQLAERGQTWDREQGLAQLARLDSEHETTLLAELSRYPEVIESAAQNLEPHLLAQYLRELAAALHGYYNNHPFLVDDDALRNARLTLIQATQQVLANGLDLLGVSAPEQM